MPYSFRPLPNGLLFTTEFKPLARSYVLVFLACLICSRPPAVFLYNSRRVIDPIKRQSLFIRWVHILIEAINLANIYLHILICR